MKRCPQCNKSYPDAERFCADDGTALISAGGAATTRVEDIPGARPGGEQSEQRIECPVCGGKAEPGEIICNFCGARLDSPATPTPGPVRPTPYTSQPLPTERPTGTARVDEHTFSDERPTGEELEGERPRGWLGIVGYVVAALVALIGGAWLALHLTKGAHAPVAQASPTTAPTPAAVAAAPQVTLASTIPTQVSGPAAAAPERNRDAIEKVFDTNRAALLDSYTRLLDTDSTAHDGMIVYVSIDSGGKVTASSIKTSTTPNPSLDAEVLNSIANWDFGPSSGPAEVDLPIIFAHAGSEAASTESALSTKLAALSPSEPPEYAMSAPSPTAAPTPAEVAAVPPPLPPPPAPPVTEAAPSKPRHRRPRLASRPPTPTLLDRVQDRLRSDPRTRRAKAYTNGGVVTLYGTVFDDKARRLAVNNVRALSGVTDVIDNLKTNTAEWQQAQNAITQQLQNAGLTGVTVKVIGKDAFLDGQVNSDLDRERAVTIAEGAAPVKVRTNLIRVAPGSVFGF
jgi:TonB family protein